MKISFQKFRQAAGLIKSMLIYNVRPFYNHRLIKFYSHFIKQGNLCFDIGAHTGSRSNAWLKLGAKVVAVEPLPLCQNKLQKKFDGNINFTLVKNAIGKTGGKEILNVSLMNPATSTLSKEWINILSDFQPSLKWEKAVEVEVITMDQLINRFGVPDFCKIDVEGYEEEVLAGLSISLPALSFEFFPTSTEKTINCINRIKDFGNYKYNWSFRETFIYNSYKFLSYNEIIEVVKMYNGRKSGDIYAFRSKLI